MLNALSGQKKFGEAEAAFEKAIDLKRDLSEANYKLGNAPSVQKKHAGAEAAYRKAIGAGGEAHPGRGGYHPARQRERDAGGEQTAKQSNYARSNACRSTTERGGRPLCSTRVTCPVTSTNRSV
jgi:tetratricopeptide (TPR) repeat protein